MLVFPYAFVDTSEAWFEPRRRRIAISAAGPASRLRVGGVFSLCCAAARRGHACATSASSSRSPRYVGAFFNLNPFLDRDGYHILVDVLREPGLRRRSREQFARRLSGEAATGDRRCWRATRWRARVVGAGGGVRHRDDAALPTVLDGGRTRLRRVDRAGYVLDRRCSSRSVIVIGRPLAGDGAEAATDGVTVARGGRRAARLIERLLADPAFRARVPARPGAGAAATRAWTKLADELAIGAGKAMYTLDLRESRSSLAGVMMAAAVEGVGAVPVLRERPPAPRRRPGAVGDVLSRVNLPARRRGAGRARRRRARRRRPRRPSLRRRRRRRLRNGAAPARPRPRRPPPRPRPPKEQAAAAASPEEAAAQSRPSRRPRRRSPRPSRRRPRRRRARRGGREDRRGHEGPAGRERLPGRRDGAGQGRGGRAGRKSPSRRRQRRRPPRQRRPHRRHRPAAAPRAPGGRTGGRGGGRRGHRRRGHEGAARQPEPRAPGRRAQRHRPGKWTRA